MRSREFVGTVEKIAFTHGGAGNQWTTIDGVKYATYWDIRSGVGAQLREGSRVLYVPYMACLWSGNPEIPHADIRRVLTKEVA